MSGKLDGVISLALALGVTALFVGQTVASWPDPLRLHKFSIQRDNPIASMWRTAPKQVAVGSAND